MISYINGLLKGLPGTKQWGYDRNSLTMLLLMDRMQNLRISIIWQWLILQFVSLKQAFH